MSTPTTGYYSVIQYCPDRSRLEAANVGVLLFAPAAGGYLRAKFASGNDRVKRFFSDEVQDFGQVRRAKDMLARRIEKEAEALVSGDLGALEHFLRLFANEFVFSPPRAVRVEQPEAELMQLFEELVGGRVRRDPRVAAPAVERIHARFAAPDLAPRVRRKVAVRVPVLGEEFEADYAFQNGRLNLIQLKEFSQTRDSDWLKDACRAAAEGRMLYRHPDAENGAQQLVVVGAFRDAADERQNRVAQLLAEHDVLFFPESQLDVLAQRILQTAH
jgi:hypothetical protein